MEELFMKNSQLADYQTIEDLKHLKHLEESLTASTNMLVITPAGRKVYMNKIDLVHTLESHVEYLSRSKAEQEFSLTVVPQTSNSGININYNYGKFYMHRERYLESLVAFKPSINMIDMYDDTLCWTDEVQVLNNLVLGRRAPSGFWTSLNERQLNNLFIYSSRYLLGIDNVYDAINITSKDVSVLPASLLQQPTFSLYKLALSAFPDLKPWKMKHAPRGTRFNNENIIEVVDIALNINGIRIADLKRKHLLAIAPCVVNGYNMKQIVEIYNNK
jgi:tetratricopeptide (TPR) repeat protein